MLPFRPIDPTIIEEPSEEMKKPSFRNFDAQKPSIKIEVEKKKSPKRSQPVYYPLPVYYPPQPK